MKTLYLECNMGAAGDMLMAALSALISDGEGFLAELNGLGIPGVKVWTEPVEKCGIMGSHIHVFVHGAEEGHDHAHEHSHACEHDHHHHHHSTLAGICEMIDSLRLSEKVKKDAKAVYRLIAEAESSVHGKRMEQIHFHEVGSLDAVTDVVGVCMLMEKIGADRIVVSPVHVGCGSVKCAHGLLPVPAPATALLLTGIPIYSDGLAGELCTPTGAALLRYFADDFAKLPQMAVSAIGYGMGTKDFDGRANCVRAMVGEAGGDMDEVTELAANVDDMTAEEIGFAMEMLFDGGALDVYAQAITMKKSRPAVKLVCMCRKEDAEALTALMFRHTTTLGVRRYQLSRAVLDRRTEKVDTPLGTIERKHAEGFGVTREKWEFEQIANLARKSGKSLFEIKKEIHE